MQYLPTIIKGIVQKVSDEMEANKDSFEVFFEYGLFQDVSKTLYKKKGDGMTIYPLVWLVMPFDEGKGRKLGIESEVNCSLIIAMPTKAEWTMQEREENNFIPRLLPIYEELLLQISKSKILDNSRLNYIEHTKRILPYWGGDEVGSGNKNLFQDFIDAVQIRDLKISVKQIC